MRKHRSPTTTRVQIISDLANKIRDARIDAMVVEYTEILTDIDGVDINELKARLAQALQGGFPPEPKWRKRVREERIQKKTVADAPEAKGSFTW